MTAFAALEARISSAVKRTLSNASASIGGAAAVMGIFDEEYAVHALGEVGMSTVAPVIELDTADLPASPVDQVLVLNGVRSFLIVEVRPSGASGRTLLVLERA